jgi:flagellar biosynthesis GTPase FlhF
MSPEQHQDNTYTYRGRSLEELVPRIRQELGDDAVIVSRRETTSGGVGGFFAKREIEVEVRPGAAFVGLGGSDSPEEPGVAAAFAQQLAEAQERARPATSPEIDALPGSADVTVDDLFPTPPPAASQNLAALFNAGLAPAEQAAEPEPVAEAPEPVVEPELEREPEVLDDDEWEEIYGDEEDDDEDVAPEEPVAEEQPTGMFDYLGVAPEPIVEEPAAAWEPPVAEPTPEPEPVAAEPEPEPEPIPLAEPVAAVISPAPPPVAGLPPAAIVAAERLVARGLRQGLAEAIADEAIAGLAPLLPGSDPKDLVTDALARRIPMHPLRRGPGVIGFVGPGGAGKTRCVARLAAAHARHGVLAVTVVALRSPDGGAELRRLLAPYGVALHAIESGAEGAGLLAELRSTGLVIVDTPGVSPRSTGELRALGTELDSLAPDELHLAVPATIGPAAAQELVSGVRELGVGALVLTHTDETEMLGTVVGLAIDSGLPLSYLARGQAVEAGLKPANATELAKDLVP